jgi:uncharacterized protein (TIGR03083 family)
MTSTGRRGDDAAWEVTADDLLEAVSTVRSVLEPVIEEDWTIPAGDLDWDVRTTLAHTADAVGWYAAHLAVQSPRRLRFDFRVHDGASNAELLDVLDAAAATLAQVARAAPPDARGYHGAGRADVCGFVAMGCDEILVHGWDVARGFGVEFAPAADLAARVLRRLFPWAPSEPAWRALLWANGRANLDSRLEGPGPDWEWHCAPLDEWDGTIPHRSQE